MGEKSVEKKLCYLQLEVFFLLNFVKVVTHLFLLSSLVGENLHLEYFIKQEKEIKF